MQVWSAAAATAAFQSDYREQFDVGSAANIEEEEGADERDRNIEVCVYCVTK